MKMDNCPEFPQLIPREHIHHQRFHDAQSSRRVEPAPAPCRWLFIRLDFLSNGNPIIPPIAAGGRCAANSGWEIGVRWIRLFNTISMGPSIIAGQIAKKFLPEIRLLLIRVALYLACPKVSVIFSSLNKTLLHQ